MILIGRYVIFQNGDRVLHRETNENAFIVLRCLDSPMKHERSLLRASNDIS